MKKINWTKVVGFLGLYLFAAGISWGIFTFLGGSGPTRTSVSLSELENARSKINLDLPRTEECPINGGMFTKIEKNIWEARRPATVMIENHHESRPPSGLSRADVVYEFVAEGGVTRFLSVFHCGVAAEDVLLAPIRSARIYFINLAAGYGDRPIFAHVGGANNICGNCPGGAKPYGEVAKKVRAIEELFDLNWRVARGNDFDTIWDSGFPVFWRNYERLDHEVATEHTMMSSTDKIFEEAANRSLGAKASDGTMWDENFTMWQFADESPSSSPAVKKIAFKFWDERPDYDVEWRYDTATNSYKRFNGGKTHTDLNTNEQLMAKNVVIMFVEEESVVDGEGHQYYEVIGEGDALIFHNGNVIEGTWEKVSQTARTIFYDDKGSEIEFVRGTIWIEGVPNTNDIEYS